MSNIFLRNSYQGYNTCELWFTWDGRFPM